MITGLYFWRWENSRDETELTILPLNGGHAVFVDTAGQKNTWLVNCGDEDAVEFTLKDFLRAQGVNKIPRLVLTEGDLQNCGGAQSLDELFGIRELWTSHVKFRSSAYRETVARFEKPPSRHKVFNFGETVGVWQILSPATANNFSRADDNALVLLGTFYNTKILLLSDLGRQGQSALLEHTNDLHANIIVTGLPTEGESLCDALIKAVQPEIIIVADSGYYANRRASRILKERIEQSKIPVIYTRDSGAVKIVTTKGGWRLETMDGQKFNSAVSSEQLKRDAPVE